jgi:hypothetical protein
MPSRTWAKNKAVTTKKYLAVARIDGVIVAAPNRSVVATPSSGSRSRRQTSNSRA